MTSRPDHTIQPSSPAATHYNTHTTTHLLKDPPAKLVRGGDELKGCRSQKDEAHSLLSDTAYESKSSLRHGMGGKRHPSVVS